MVFSSILFLLYFLPAFLLLYFIVPKKAKNAVLLLSSILFYSWGAPKFILVILSTTLIDFLLVKKIAKSDSTKTRKSLLLISVSLNIGLLFYFKYVNFFIENFNAIFHQLGLSEIPWVSVILPIGISFYTFETITYVVDVYRKEHDPLHNFWDYLLYILFFPKLIAGPIVRYQDFARQLQSRYSNENLTNRIQGFFRFVIGLSKKVLIANQLGLAADSIFIWDYQLLDSFSAWMALLAFSFQLYFDFSGYSDMAIGLALMLGIKIPENFDNPYVSKSVTEFWRRWHISLGNWMKNYLYIPLGGNQSSKKSRVYLNLWLVFIASGFWHGASWNFILWGAYHGLFLILERSLLKPFYQKLNETIQMALTFFIVIIGWVLFKVNSISPVFTFYKKLFTFNFHDTLHLFDMEFYTYLSIAILFAFFTATRKGKKVHDIVFLDQGAFWKKLISLPVALFLLILCICSITGFHFNPFIYFRF
jgi:alginate O-acetyltransferase complex protein AlgI